MQIVNNRVKLEYVNLGDLDQFDTGAIAAYEAGYNNALARGIKIKALIICNPHNPLGKIQRFKSITSF